jgi:sugar O-acyltransferase (sialic acid O-acetyltransferase NeuD family)
MAELFIIGASGHARVSLDILEAQGLEVAGFFDDDPELIGKKLHGISVMGDLSDFQIKLENEHAHYFIAVGNNHNRKKIALQLKRYNNGNSLNAIHPSAVISSRIKKGYGNFIAPGAIINTGTVLGDYIIINTGATVDHDNTLCDYVQLSPGCNLAGNVMIEEGAFIGTGAVIIPGKRIGAYAVIGAGAVVIHDIPPLSVAVGVPARIIKHNHVAEFCERQL